MNRVSITAISFLALTGPFLSGQDNRPTGESEANATTTDRLLSILEQKTDELERLQANGGPHSTQEVRDLLSQLEAGIAELEALRLARAPGRAVPTGVEITTVAKQISGAGPKPAGGPLEATLRLKSKPRLAKPLSHEDSNLLGIFEYEVIEVLNGEPPPSLTVRVAHGIRWGGRRTAVLNRPVGATVTLDLVPLWFYPSMRKVERIGDLRDESVAGALYTPRIH